MQTDHEAPEVLSRGHAVGVLTDQHKIWPERSAETNTETQDFITEQNLCVFEDQGCCRICKLKFKTCTNKIQKTKSKSALLSILPHVPYIHTEN